MSLKEARAIWAAKARRAWALAWGLCLDLFWLAAVAVMVGAAIWTTAQWAEASGRDISWLSAAADYVRAAAERVIGRR